MKMKLMLKMIRSLINGIEIAKENLKEYLLEEDGTTGNIYNYNKVSGTKYYKYLNSDNWFYINNKGMRENLISEKYNEDSTAAQLYYKKAKEFTNKVKGVSGEYHLDNLKTTDAVDSNGNPIATSNGWRRILYI